MDESGFSLVPLVRKTWSKRGETPILRHSYRRSKISVIAGICTNPHIFAKQIRNRAVRTHDVVAFLKHLLRHGPKKICLVWDNISTHKASAVRQLVEKNRKRIEMHFLPAYAPELNAEENVWGHMKWHTLVGASPKNTQELSLKIRHAIACIRKRPELIRSFFRGTPLDFCPFVN